MKNVFLKLLFLILAHGMCEAAFSSYTFGHGLRGNSERYLKPYFNGFFKEGLPVLRANGPDCIEETISESIDLANIPTSTPWWGRFKYHMRRHLILFRALRHAVMGQQRDQNNVMQCIRDNNYCACHSLYIGHSKGAALGAQLLQKHQFAGAILIAPFSDGNQAFRDFPPISSLPHTGFIDNYVVPCLRRVLMPHYNSKGQQPCDFTDQSPNVRTQTPILIVSVKGDNKVPQWHQIALYKKLKDTGHNVYFYEIKNGNHDILASAHSAEHQALVNVVTGFQNYVDNKKHDRSPVALASEERWYSSPSSTGISGYFTAREQLEKSMELLKKHMLVLS